MKNIKITFPVAAFLFAAFGLSAQNQFLDYELVCWDSAGVTTPLLKRIYDVNGFGRNHSYHDLTTLAKVVPGTGTVGSCNKGNDISVQLDSVLVELDSLGDPQQCSCIYSVAAENHEYFIGPNTQYAQWTYSKVVTRNCGNGNEEVVRIPQTFTAGSDDVAHLRYVSGVNDLVNGGYIDSMGIFLYNPADTFFIVLDPAKVLVSYPGISVDTADLRFNGSNEADMITALGVVIEFAFTKFETDSSLPTIFRSYTVVIDGSGDVIISFVVKNAPYGPYSNLLGTNGFYYHTDFTTPITGGTQFSYPNWEILPSHTTPCGTAADHRYQDGFVDVGFLTQTAMPMDTPSPSSILQTDQTCAQSCPGTGGCITPCGTIDVNIVSDSSETCEVIGEAGQEVVTSSTFVLNSSTYHSIGIAITSGTVSIKLHNAVTSTETYSAGQTISLNHPNRCNLLVTGITVDASSGTAKIVTLK